MRSTWVSTWAESEEDVQEAVDAGKLNPGGDEDEKTKMKRDLTRTGPVNYPVGENDHVFPGCQ